MDKASKPSLNRRSVFAGAGAVGALAAVAAVAPVVRKDPEVAQTVSKDAAQGGYQLTDHVRQYYATARV